MLGIGTVEVQVAAWVAGVLGLLLSIVNFYRSWRAEQERLEVTFAPDLDEATNESFALLFVANRGGRTAFVERAWMEDSNGKRFQWFPEHGTVTDERRTILPGDRISFLQPQNHLKEIRATQGYGEFVEAGVTSTRSKRRRWKRDVGIYRTAIPKDERGYY